MCQAIPSQSEIEFQARLPQPSIAAPTSSAELNARQIALGMKYRHHPKTANTTDHARTHALNKPSEGALDPLHTRLVVGQGNDITLPVGLHTAVGGLGDILVPGDLLCAALASCTDSTIRVVVNSFGVELLELGVDVSATVGVRATLCISNEVPVAFQSMNVRVRLRAHPDTPEDRLARLIATAEHRCVVMRTLRDGVPIEIECDSGANS